MEKLKNCIKIVDKRYYWPREIRANMLKLRNFNKFTYRLFLSSLLPLTCVMFTILSTEAIFNSKVEDLNTFSSELKDITQDVYEIRKDMDTFFKKDASSDSFYITGSSDSLENYTNTKKKVYENFDKLVQNQSIDKNLAISIIALKQDISRNFVQFEEIVSNKLQLGYKDWGRVGSWKRQRSKLEDESRNLKNKALIIEILRLGQLEKDYLLTRDESLYLKHQYAHKSIRKQFTQRKSDQYKKLTFLLDNYIDEFSSYVKLDKIFYKNLETFETSRDKTARELLQLISKSNQLFNSNYNLFQYVINIVVLLCSFIGLFYSLKSGKSLAEPILKLEKMLSSYTEVDSEKLKKINSTDEINHLRDSILHFKNETDYQKKLLAAQAKLSTIGEVSGNISHEILNPLTVISTNVTLLKRRIKKNKQVNDSDFSGIENAVEKATNIINSVRKLARTEHVSELTLFKVDDLIAPIDFLLGKKLRDDDIDLLIRNNITGEEIYGNESLLTQVVINLVSNSRHAISKLSTKWIEVSIEQDEFFLTIKISDSGKGIPKPIREKLFVERVTTKSVDEGTGLGLPLCKRIIDQHNGKIWIDAEAMNTTFIIQLPSANSVLKLEAA